MKRLLRASSIPLAFLSCPCTAQSARTVQAPSGFATLSAPCVEQGDGSCVSVKPATPLPTTQAPLLAATATPQTGTATATAVAPTSGTAAIASGTTTIGPFAPQLGRDIVLKLSTPDSAAFTCQLFDSIDGGTTKLPLTIFDTPIGGPYTSPVNSAIVAETVAGTTEWLVCTVTAGTLKYGVMN